MGLLTPPRALWWLLTNVRFAMALLAVLCGVSLAGVLIPQVPLNVRGDSAMEANWLDSQEGRFGLLTAAIDRIGLFDLFHTGWFAVLLALTAAATGAYILSRCPGVWLAITRPRKRVPDGYFENAPVRAQAEGPVNLSHLVRTLRGKRYRVEVTPEDEVTYLFADRFQWAQLGSLLTHAAVIVFILSAVVSKVDAFESPLFLAEGTTLPVFPVRNPEQLQVQLLDAHGEFAADGQPLDYRSDLAIYRNGEEVKRCSSTVNSPCSYAGYRFYQAAYYGFGAEVQVRDLATGNVVYQETLALAARQSSPHVVIANSAGQTVLDQTLVLTEELSAGDATYRGTLVTLPGGRLLTIGLRQTQDGADLAVFEPGSGGGTGIALLLAEGQTGEAGGLRVTYARQSMTPAADVADFPSPPEAAAGRALGEAKLQLSNVVYGTERASEGNAPAEPAGGPPRLTITSLGPKPMVLEPGQSATVGSYEYKFLGQREFAGIQVKRDRSDYLVWAAAALIVLGLMVTFWVPRRRLWARISSNGISLAGQAPAHADFARELRSLAAEAGARPVLTAEDDRA